LDSTGHLVHGKLSGGYIIAETHTVTEDGDLLFIGGYHEVQKLTSDGRVTTLFTTDRPARCIHSSRINGDILVGSGGRVTRYNRAGQELQVVEYYEGLSYSLLHYITENYNGDVLISDRGQSAVVAMDKSGRRRFVYRGLQSVRKDRWYDFLPCGICTDIHGHVLVCDSSNHCVHLLDQDGHFLSLLLTKEHGIRDPWTLCVDDQHNLYVGQGYSNTINVYRYLQHTDVK
jgi:hypothetical protein